MADSNYNIKATLEVVNRFTKPVQDMQKQLNSLQQQFDQTRNHERQVDEQNKKTSNSFGSLTKSITKMIATAGGIATLKSGFTALFSEGSSMENYRIKLNAILKDTELAGEKIKYAKEFANKTPFETKDIVDGMVKLESYGIKSTDAVMTNIGNMASIMGKSYDQAVEAIADAQTGELERLKEFGIKKDDIVAQGAKTMAGIELVNNKGQIVNQEKFNEALYQIMEDRYKNGMELQSKTASGMISTTKGMISNIIATLAGIDDGGNVVQGGFLDTISQNIKKLNDYITKLNNDGTIQQWADKFTNGIKFVTQHFDEIKKGLIGFGIAYGTFKAISGGFTIANIFKGLTGKNGNLTKLIANFSRFHTSCNNISRSILRFLNPINLVKGAFHGLSSVFGLITHPFSTFKTLLTGGFNLIKNGAMGMIKGLVGGFKMIFSPMNIVIGIIALVVMAVIRLYNTNTQFRAKVQEVWQHIQVVIAEVCAIIGQWIDKLKQWISEHQEQINTFKEVMGAVWDAICLAIGVAIETIIDIISGWFDFFRDTFTIIGDLLNGDFSKAWDDFKLMIKHVIDNIKGWWDDLKNFFTNNPLVANIKKVFSGGDESYGEPNPDTSDESTENVGHNATGTRDWRGGLTWVGEKGAELINLPSGSQVYTHEESIDILRGANGNKGISISIGKIAEHLEVKNDMDIKQIGQQIGNSIIDTLYNAGFNY